MATKKFVPRGNNEGGIGDSSRRWKEVHAATGSFYNGLSGSLQTLTDGTSYLVEGANVTITTGSSGQITIASSAGGTMSSFNAKGDSGPDQTITDGNNLEIKGDGTNISTTAAATDRINVALNQQVSITGLTASNGVQIGGTPGHELTNDAGTLKWKGTAIGAGSMTSFKVTGSHDVSSELTIQNNNVLTFSGSNAIVIKTGAVNTVSASLKLDGSTLQQSDAGLKVNPNLTLDSLNLNGNLKVDGTVTTIETENLLVRDRFILLASGTTQAAGEPPVQGGIIVASGALGDHQSLIFGASGSIWHATQGDAEDGVITSIPPTPGNPQPYVPLAASEFMLSGSNVRKLTTDGTNVILTSAGNLQLTASNGIDVKDDTIFRQGLSGSLQTLANGSSYLVEGNNITIVTASNGQVTISSTGGGGGGGSSDIWLDEGDSGEKNFIIRPKGTSGSLGLGSTGDDPANYGIFLSGSGHAVFNEQGKNVDFRIETENSSSMFFVDGNENRIGVGFNAPLATLHIKESNAAVRIQRSTNTNSSSLEFAGQAGHIGAIVHQANGNDLIFRTHNGNHPEEVLRLGSHFGSDNRQVIILSGNHVAATSMQPKQSTDINFFVSGSIGSRGTSTKGTAVFGGDMHVSGNITVDGSSAFSVKADDVLVGDAPAIFKTTDGDIGISGSNIGLTGSIISLHDHENKRGLIDLSSNAIDFKFNYANKLNHTFLKAVNGSDTLILSASSNVAGHGGSLVLGTSHLVGSPVVKPNIKLEVNDNTKSTIEFDSDNVIFNHEISDVVYRYNSDSIKFSKIVTASLGVSSSLYTFENKPTGQSFENGQLINITGSLFWKNPSDSTELKLLSGSEGGSGGVNFTAGRGVHLNDSNVLTASLLETGNLRFASNKLDIKEDVSITNLTASNAVSSSLYTFKDVGNGTTSNYSNQLYNVTGTLYWNTHDALLSGSDGYGLVRNISTKPLGLAGSADPISINKSNSTILLTVGSTNLTGGLPNYTSLPTGFYFTTKNKSDTNEAEIKPHIGQRLDDAVNDSLKLQPKASLTFVYSGDTNYGWIVE